MRDSDLDGDQDLTFWLRALEDVLREILGDERMAGHQEFRFEISRTEEGERQRRRTEEGEWGIQWSSILPAGPSTMWP